MEGNGLSLVAEFHYPATSGRWFVSVASRVYWLDFSGEVWMSAASGQVSRVSWTSGKLPAEAGIERIVWTVSFKAVDVYGRTYVLPETGEYRVVHRGDWIDWNVTRFEGRGRYGSQAWLSFGE